MRLVVAHNAVSDESAPDEADVLAQVEAVSRALGSLGHEVVVLPCGLNLSAVAHRLEAMGPDMVFNLVESLAGHGRLIHLFPSLLDAIGLPYSGSQAETLWMTSHKVMAKRHMGLAEIPTPVWVGPVPEDLSIMPPDHTTPSSVDYATRRWIIKSLWEHASLGLESANIVDRTTEKALKNMLADRAEGLGGACFAEAYIHGREFNLSLLAGAGEPQVLPPAEIIFEGYDTTGPHIVDYRAKWMTDSYGYRHTPRRFNFDSKDKHLLTRLEVLARKCWYTFSLRGYARVDFRVDEAGRPWILEINANPCISSDAGFAAAVDAAGLDFTEAVERIVQDGLRRFSSRRNTAAVSD